MQPRRKAAVNAIGQAALLADFAGEPRPEAIAAEKTELSAKLSEAQNKLQNADAAITELKASMEKTAAEHAAALSDFDAKVAAKAATMLAQWEAGGEGVLIELVQAPPEVIAAAAGARS